MFFEPSEPSEPGPLRGPIVISNGVEKSPRTMLPAVSRGYVSRRNVSLKSDRLNVSNYLKSQISNLKSISPVISSGAKWSPKISPHYAARRKWGYVSRHTANLTSEV